MLRARQWLLFLIPAVLCAGSPRFARVGSFAGGVQVQVHAYDAWRPALRNVPLVESSRIESAALSQVELEFDEGSAFRMVGDALAEISDYAQLSTGQRITLISLDRGTAYFTGHAGENDSVGVAVPGAHVLLRRASKVRFIVSASSTEIAILEGTVRFATPAAELELRQGQWVELNPANHSRFNLRREIPELESDPWTDPRATELEHAGHWIHTDDAGLVWQPKVGENWAPFQAGEWRWYDELGYTWIAAEPWGWKPYRYGRWLLHGSLGWVWAPGDRQTLKPGEVYWMTGNNFIGWGPLAPGEEWTGAGPPRQYAALNTTLGRFQTGAHEFAPAADLVKPKDLLAAARFALALPSPPVLTARFDAVRMPLRSAGTKLISFAADAVNVPGVSYTQHPPAPQQQAPPPNPPAAPLLRPVRAQAPPPPVVVEVVEPVEVYYPYPVYTGFVVLNPPVKKDSKDKSKSNVGP
jgi:hypothetical protein